MEQWMEALSLILKIFTVYTAIVSLFFLLPRRKIPRAQAKTRFAVLLAARNEEAVIGRTVGQLLAQHYPAELFDVYVIPNNCTDDTEGAARRAGAQILPCLGPVRNKGDALHCAFAALKDSGYDAYCVFDADNLVDPDFLARMNDAFCAGAQAAKGKQTAMNPHDAWISGCYDLYFENFNLLYNRPRGNLGLSAKLVGTGFAVSQALMDRLGGWNTETMAEDAEFAAQCSMAGVKVWWVPEALTYDEEPITFHQSMVQRRRWCSGVMAVAGRYLPRLWRRVPSRNFFFCLDFAVFLSMPMVQVLALLPGIWAVAQAVAAENWLILVASLLSFWGGLTLTALALALVGRRKLRPMWKSIVLYPLFTVSLTYPGRPEKDPGLEAHRPPGTACPVRGRIAPFVTIVACRALRQAIFMFFLCGNTGEKTGGGTLPNLRKCGIITVAGRTCNPDREGRNMQHVIITIARQHGSGGRLIGECLAKKMGIAYYDKELISLTAKKTGFALDFVKEVEEKQTSSFLYSIYAAAVVPSVYEQARNAQFSVIRELASKGSCVIVGRAADCILKNLPYCVHVFVHAPLEERIRRATEDYQEAMDNPERALQKKDKARAAFYNTYSEYPWGDLRNYDMAINSTIGIEKSADIILDYVKAKFNM